MGKNRKHKPPRTVATKSFNLRIPSAWVDRLAVVRSFYSLGGSMGPALRTCVDLGLRQLEEDMREQLKAKLAELQARNEALDGLARCPETNGGEDANL